MFESRIDGRPGRNCTGVFSHPHIPHNPNSHPYKRFCQISMYQSRPRDPWDGLDSPGENWPQDPQDRRLKKTLSRVCGRLGLSCFLPCCVCSSLVFYFFWSSFSRFVFASVCCSGFFLSTLKLINVRVGTFGTMVCQVVLLDFIMFTPSPCLLVAPSFGTCIEGRAWLSVEDVCAHAASEVGWFMIL